MASVEVELKAADKRIGGLERALDSLTKEIRQSGSGGLDKLVASLEKRITTLETIVKSIAAASKAGGGVDDSSAIRKMIAESEHNIRKEQRSIDKDAADNLEKLRKESDLLNLALKTVNAKTEKHATDAKARVDKQISDQVAANVALGKQVGEQGKQLAIMAKIEARLAAVEGIATNALSMAAKRN
jgi:hypothetical protein